MEEKPHPSILNREESRAHVEQHLAKQTALLRDLANYGSNLVLRAYNSSEKQTVDAVVCGVFLKQVATMVDATEVLLSSGCCLSAFLPVRSAFEASIYAEWVLAADSETRARRYVVADHRAQRQWAQRSIPGTPEEKEMTEITKQLGYEFHVSHPTMAELGSKRLAEVDAVLAQPQLALIHEEFTAARGKRRYDPEWFTVGGGPKNIREVAIAVKRLPEYQFFYSKGAEVSHVGSYRNHIRLLPKGELRFVPIRHLENVKLLIQFVGGVALHTYRKVMEHYRQGELPALSKKYLEDWRDAHIRVPNLQYDKE